MTALLRPFLTFIFAGGKTVPDTVSSVGRKGVGHRFHLRFALSIASVLFQLLPKFLMDYCAGWGNHRNRDGTAPPVLNIHLWGRKTVPDTLLLSIRCAQGWSATPRSGDGRALTNMPACAPRNNDTAAA